MTLVVVWYIPGEHQIVTWSPASSVYLRGKGNMLLPSVLATE